MPNMHLIDRIRYSLYLAAVSASLIGPFVSIASADAIGMLPISAFRSPEVSMTQGTDTSPP